MVSRQAINDFLGQKRLAVVGVSRNGQGFGQVARKELAAQGYSVRVVHPDAAEIDGVPCARSLKELAGQVDGVVLVTPPASTETLVREAEEAGIRHVWMQQGAESDAAVKWCEEHGMNVVHHECILMFAGHPGWFHRAHRWMRGTFGQLPG